MKSLALQLWLTSLTLGCLVVGNSATAQIIPDNTLPVNSNVTQEANTSKIEGGTVRGTNLFHSFREFSVPTGGEAFFNNVPEIRNILTRVTGNNLSNIDGLIRANGANLFLMNPNGIIFGPNARLDIGGSFLGTTANAIQFGKEGLFSATTPEAPSELLTVNPSALLFNQIAAARIQNNSVADSGLDPSGTFTAKGLRVPNGQSLLLVGGNVSMDRGGLFAFAGRVELGGLAGAGTVGLNGDGSNLSLSFPDGVERSDLLLTNGAQVNVLAGGGGSIAMNPRNLEVRKGSQLLAGIGEGLGTPEARAGDITINATDTVLFDNNSYAFNDVNRGSVGNAGNVSITTGSLEVLNGARLTSNVLGQGNGGSVAINATDSVKFDGSVASTTVYSEAENAGDVSITTGSLSLTNGARLVASIGGQGDAGTLQINATDFVNISQSEIANNVTFNSIGNGGNIAISSRSLSLNNSELNTSMNGQGNAGSVLLRASDSIVINGNSTITTGLGPTGVGKGGNIDIRASSLSIKDGAQLQSAIFMSSASPEQAGQGDAGNVNIDVTGAVTIDGWKKIPSGIYSLVSTGGRGKGGNITISAGSFSLTNGANVVASTNGQGDAGNISITTGSLSVTNGAALSANTFGKGDAGNINIDARDTVSFDAGDAFSSVASGGVGKAGGISITTGSLSVTNGAQLVAVTRGKGNAGNISINARDTVSFDGSSGAFSSVESPGEGNGGGISITTGSLSLTNGAGLSASSAGQGTAGDIEIASRSIRLDNKAGIVATTASGNGGGITLRAQDLLLLRRNSQISTSAGTAQQGGDGGNITIDAPNGFIVAVPKEDSDITANAVKGQGGNIKIIAREVFGIEPREQKTPESDITASSELGIAGTVQVNTSNLDPSRGFVELPVNLVDPSTQIAQGCTPGSNVASRQNRFTITGRGGLPASLNEIFPGEETLVELLELPDSKNSNDAANQNIPASPSPRVSASSSHPQEIIEAQGWVVDADGAITLVAEVPNTIPHTPALTPASCQTSVQQ